MTIDTNQYQTNKLSSPPSLIIQGGFPERDIQCRRRRSRTVLPLCKKVFGASRAWGHEKSYCLKYPQLSSSHSKLGILSPKFSFTCLLCTELCRAGQSNSGNAFYRVERVSGQKGIFFIKKKLHFFHL